MEPLGGTELQYQFLQKNVPADLLEKFQICLSVPGRVPLSNTKINILWFIIKNVFICHLSIHNIATCCMKHKFRFTSRS